MWRTLKGAHIAIQHDFTLQGAENDGPGLEARRQVPRDGRNPRKHAAGGDGEPEMVAGAAELKEPSAELAAGGVLAWVAPITGHLSTRFKTWSVIFCSLQCEVMLSGDVSTLQGAPHAGCKTPG